MLIVKHPRPSDSQSLDSLHQMQQSLCLLDFQLSNHSWSTHGLGTVLGAGDTMVSKKELFLVTVTVWIRKE